MSNNITFLIENDSTGKKIVVHHDRIERVKTGDNNTVSSETTNEESDDDFDSDSSASESDQGNDDIEPTHEAERRYPTRIRTQRQIDGAIPWDAIDL